MALVFVNRIVATGIYAGLWSLGLGATSSAETAQVVIGSRDPNYCQQIEHLDPNLIIVSRTHLFGVITDSYDVPIVNKPVILKTYESSKVQKLVREVKTNERGEFDLGLVKSGRYRIIASWTRSFRQPTNLKCEAAGDCNLKIRLIVPPTDQPDSFCPVR